MINSLPESSIQKDDINMLEVIQNYHVSFSYDGNPGPSIGDIQIIAFANKVTVLISIDNNYDIPKDTRTILLNNFFEENSFVKDRMQLCGVEYRSKFNTLCDPTGTVSFGHSSDNTPWRSLDLTIRFANMTSKKAVFHF